MADARLRRMRFVLGRTWPVLCSVLLLPGCGGESGEAQSAPAARAASSLPPPGTESPQDVFDLRQIGVNEGSVMTAAIGVVDFSDFGCIYCANFHNADYPALHDEFVTSGDVLWKYVPISIGGFPNGDLAGLTGICADEIGRTEGFARMRDHLFVQREEWLASPPDGAREVFVSYAEELGFDPDAFTACLDGEAASARLTRNNNVAHQVGVTATPTFIVQGSPVRGAPPLADFQNVLRRLVAESRGDPLPTGDPAGAGPGAPDA